MRKVAKVHRRCENCGKINEHYKSDINRNKGLYCPSSINPTCSQSTRHNPRFDKTCKNCGMPFRTTINTLEFCCIDCQISHFESNNSHAQSSR